MWWQVKLCDPFNTCHLERFRDEFSLRLYIHRVTLLEYGLDAPASTWVPSPP